MEVSGPLEDEERSSLAALGGGAKPLAVIPGTPGPDVLVGTQQADQIDALAGDDDVSGRGGDDEISGGDGSDALRGGPGGDTIDGGPGDDTIDGGGGDDDLSGGAGADLLRGKGGSDDLSGGDDGDELRGGGLGDVLAGDLGDDLLLGGGGDDALRGNQGDDTLEGGNGDDTLEGGGGNDTLKGEFGNDRLDGDSGDDTLEGGPGTDELRGGPGADTLDGKGGELDILVGGAGADVFTLSTPDSADRVLDFVEGEDRFDISALLPDFQPDDDLDLFVQLEIVPQGTRLSIDPSGGGTGFQLIAGLEGVEVSELSPADLGLATPLPADPTVVSANAAGEVANDVAFAPSLSRDGSFITFASLADNLVDGDANGAFDIFRKNLTTGEVDLVTQFSVPGQGVQPTNGDSYFSALSANGEVVAFDSAAGNLAANDTGQRNVFVTTVGSDDVDLVSIVGNRFASEPSIANGGTLVAFSATATGRAETGEPAPIESITSRVYVRDLTDGSLVEASSDAAGNYADQASANPEISGNGDFVVFESDATNLDGTDDNPGLDIYVKSLIDGSVQNASTDATGAQGFGDSTAPTISGNGRFVAFQSTARFVVEDFDNAPDIYLKDLQTGELTLVTINDNGIKSDGASFSPSISDDGRFIAFRSAASNLVAGDDNGRPDIFVADADTGQFQRIALESDTSTANPQLVEPTISGDGALVAFVDQVTAGGGGGLNAGQVVAAPVDVPAGSALALADVLSSDLEPIDGPAAASRIEPAPSVAGGGAATAIHAIAPAADLGALVVQPEAA
jgi:Tol biopolymer transport system component